MEIKRRRLGVMLLLGYATYWALIAVAGCARQKAPGSVAQATTQTSATCATCHAEIFAAWRGTDHALASRPVGAADRPAFTGAAGLAAGGSRFAVEWRGDRPVLSDAKSGLQEVAADFILGAKPLWQPVLPVGHGRWQPTDLAYDPAQGEWFNVFGQENRQPGEWGHWTGRGMNWNSMCARCHLTGYEKNYEATTDSYHSTWVEHGVGCIQCHGPTAPGHGTTKSLLPSAAAKVDRQKSLQTCLACHSRAEQLGTDAQPGDNFLDHYRPALPGDGTTFHADGQQRDEVFNGTSFLLSRMGHAGVTCLDCHDPHTTSTIRPAGDNQLCLQCHAAPGRVMPGGTRAVVIDPTQHSHHAAGSAGNSCVACHMPTTTYMQRAPRHDHGWLKPDPLLTKELGIPNACTRCHADQPVDWAIDATTRWYGDRLDSQQRARARAVSAAQAQAPDAARAVLAVFEKEDIPGWRAALLEMLTPYLDQTAAITPVARQSLGAGNPLERAAAVRLLAGDPGAQNRMRELLRDPVRLVRIDAEFALAFSLDAKSPERKELDDYLAASADQPLGRVRLGQDQASRGQLAEAQRQMETAVSWDPWSAPIESALAMILSQRGNELEAATHFRRAAELDPRNAADAFRAALAYAGASRLVDAESALRLALTREPGMHRAWYNLGLLLAQTQRLPQAVEALRRAESLDVSAADYPYALATVYLRLGDQPAALEAARRTLAIAPNHAGARSIAGLR